MSTCLSSTVLTNSVFTDLFYWFLGIRKARACYKSATVIPMPKKSNAACLNDYRRVVLTSVIMKVLEWLVCDHLPSIAQLDMCQFADQPNRSVEDAVSVC